MWNATFTYDRRTNIYRYNRGGGLFGKLAKHAVGIGKKIAKKGISAGKRFAKNGAKKALTKAKTLAKKKVGRIAKGAAAVATRKMKETASKGASAVVATSPQLKAITKQKIKKAVGVTTKHLLAG